MRKLFSEFAIAGVILVGMACALPISTASPTLKIYGGGEEFLGPTAAADATRWYGTADAATQAVSGKETVMVSLTPTPSLLPPDQCPPFAYDADLPALGDPQGFIGKHYDSLALPADLDFISGTLLDDVHAWTRIRYSGRNIEWLERLVCRDEGGHAFFTIVDALLLPSFTDDQTEAGLCWLNGEQLHAIVAIGHVDLNGPVGSYRNVEGWKFDHLDYGYRIDLGIEKFVPLPMQGLECVWPNSSLEGG